MDTTQALLYVLLGMALGSAVVLAWRLSERQIHQQPTPVPPVLSEGVATVLAVLRSSAVVLDADGRVVKASAPAIVMGLVKDSGLAVPELQEMVGEVVADGQVRDAELELKRGPGRPSRHVLARVAPLSSTLTLILVEDRTREHRVETLRRDFVANVSHELKTPVGAIKLLAEAASDAAGDPDAVRRFAARMNVESDRLTRLVGQIIELSRLQGDDPLEEPAPVPVDRLIDRVIDAHLTDADARQVKLDRVGPTGLVILGNEEQIAVAVGNLVSNALTYSPAGSTVTITAEASEGNVDVSVRDQGIGIAPAEVDRIFERFYRVDPARQRSTGGTGLGLSIVKHVAASHGGDVKVWSAEGAGSTFTLSVPRRMDPSEQAVGDMTEEA